MDQDISIQNPCQIMRLYCHISLFVEKYKTLFCLEVFVRFTTLEFLLDPGEYEIDLQVSAANTKPTICTFCLNHTGQWLETERKMFTQGLGLDIKSKRYNDIKKLEKEQMI